MYYGRVGVLFKYPLGSVQTSYFTDVVNALQMGPSDDLGSFNHMLFVLGCAWIMIVCDVSSHDALYCSPVKADQNLILEFIIPKK